MVAVRASDDSELRIMRCEAASECGTVESKSSYGCPLKASRSVAEGLLRAREEEARSPSRPVDEMQPDKSEDAPCILMAFHS